MDAFGRYAHFAFEIDVRQDDWPNLAGTNQRASG